MPSNAEPLHLRVTGPTRLKGDITLKTSKNASVALLCASLLNRGTTTLRNVARIEEVNRLIEVLNSVGAVTKWLGDSNDLLIDVPEQLDVDNIDREAAARTRSVLMLLAPFMHRNSLFRLPCAGGCDLGTRTVGPHLAALRPFGLQVNVIDGWFDVWTRSNTDPTRPVVLMERGDTVTENVLMAAATRPVTTKILNASSNYMVQDLCFYLQQLGVEIDGIGTTTLTVTGRERLEADVDYAPSEDPIEAMSLLTAAIVTSSSVTVKRCPIEFLEVELAILENMGFQYERSEPYLALNGQTALVDITTRPSRLVAARDRIHPMPYPGLNIDNVPFFALIAAHAEGTTVIHDWVYDNRAIHMTHLSELGVNLKLFDPHRLAISGPTKWRATSMTAPPALRPAAVMLLAMLAAPGVSELRGMYVIHRGYECLAERLNLLGANISAFR